MPISYNKLVILMKNKGVSRYQLKKDKVVGGATLDKIFEKQDGYISTKVIEHLCKYLDCQPGDIMEYVEEEDEK